MRKKVIALVLTSALLVAAAGCGNTGTQSSGGQTENTQPAAEISDNIFDCYEEDAHSSREEILSWVEGLGY